MKPNRVISAVFTVCAFLAVSAAAQKPPPVKYPKPVVVTSGMNGTNSATGTVTDVKSGAEKVSIQIKNVTKFIYVLGGVASGIEQIDADAKARKATRAAIDRNETNKKEVMQAIRNLRAGLAVLEGEFRTQAALKKFLPQIEGITDLSAQCEDLARAGQFSVSGKPLLLVVEKLSDTLVAMP